MGIYAHQTYAWAAITSEDLQKNEADTVQKIVQKMLGKSVCTMTEMKHLDDENTFFYIDFSEGGYAVFLKETFEMLEYSPTGRKMLSNNYSTYYLGPNCYCTKEGGIVKLNIEDIFTNKINVCVTFYSRCN